MVSSVTFFVSLTFTLCLSAEDKSHDVWITKVEDAAPYADPDWIVNETYRLNKVDRKRRTLDMNVTFVQEFSGDKVMCELKTFQKSGGKYVKAALHIPKTSLCKLIGGDTLAWQCIQKTTNLPKSCPIPPGDYYMKGFDPDLCDYPKMLPPNGAEDFKIEFTGSVGPKQIFKHVAYAKIKKRMQLV